LALGRFDTAFCRDKTKSRFRNYPAPNNSGSLAMLLAIRRASSHLSKLASRSHTCDVGVKILRKKHL
jgi:hypothetical protein